jgi:hypothetical protein
LQQSKLVGIADAISFGMNCNGPARRRSLGSGTSIHHFGKNVKRLKPNPWNSKKETNRKVYCGNTSCSKWNNIEKNPACPALVVGLNASTASDSTSSDSPFTRIGGTTFSPASKTDPAKRNEETESVE